MMTFQQAVEAVRTDIMRRHPGRRWSSATIDAEELVHALVALGILKLNAPAPYRMDGSQPWQG